MDIHERLLIDNLKGRFSVLRFGKWIETPLLRPVFYSGVDAVEKNRVYMAKPDALPDKSLLDDSSLLICVEGLPSLAYQHCGAPLLVIRDAGVMDVFNEVLAIFERYEIWERSLGNILATSADLSELVQVTAPLLVNDITIVDKNLRIVAAANYRRDKSGAAPVVVDTPLMSSMPLDIANRYRHGFKEHKSKRGSFFADEGCYCANLFLEDEYWGNISLYPMLSPLRPSDPYIFDILANAVRKALRIRNISIRRETHALERVVRKLLDGEAVEADKLPGDGAADEGRFLFLCIQVPDDLQKMPAEYICQALLNRFSNLVIFPYGGHIVGLKDLNGCASGYAQFISQLQADLREFRLRVGLSERFQRLRRVRIHYQQARSALELGMSADAEGELYFFRDYALRYLMYNSSGVFPAEYLCPQGLLALRRYDQGSDVDYWATLRCYLDTERNLSQTAKLLCIHRNTMLQRVDRIHAILDMDLEDAETRLWLRIAIWLMDAEAAAGGPA